jgi:ABC-type transport system substrate-binding protein
LDRIEFVVGRSRAALEASVEEGTIDLVLDHPSPQSAVDRFRSDTERRGRVRFGRDSKVVFISLNLAIPPFDDRKVRRAVAFALDDRALISARTRELKRSYELAGHLIPDEFEGGLLRGWDAYPHDPEAASSAMASSRYDTDGDGACDASACRKIELATWEPTPPYPEMFRTVRRDLAPLGLTFVRLDLGIGRGPYDDAYGSLIDPRLKPGLIVDTVWRPGFPVASGYFVGMVSGRCFGSGSGTGGCSNYSRLGAPPRELAAAGYRRTTVPSVDPEIHRCLALTGQDQTACWARLDQLVMTLVPVVPIAFETSPRIVSANVDTYAFDALTGRPALDEISVQP